MQKVKILDSFAHGRPVYEAGQIVEFSPGEAEELRKAGRVEFVNDVAPQTGVTDSQDTDDLLGDADADVKAAPAPQNKMEPAPANKGKKK